MSVTPEQLAEFAAANKSNLDALLGLSQKAFEGIEKLVELNLQVSRAALDESAEHAKALLSAKDAQELLTLQAGLLQPASEKALAYGRQVYDIASSTQAEVAKLAEAQVSDAQQKLQAFVETAVKNAPAGSESAVAMVKSAVAAATNAIESAQKAAKQAATATEANFQTLSQNAANAAKAATQAVPKAAARRTAAQ
ncbi:MAG: phasin family protein [Leptothrix sp. (in: b-proteobacteria)]